MPPKSNLDGKKSLRKQLESKKWKRLSRKINIVRYWNIKWGFTYRKNLKLLYQTTIFRILQKVRKRFGIKSKRKFKTAVIMRKRKPEVKNLRRLELFFKKMFILCYERHFRQQIVKLKSFKLINLIFSLLKVKQLLSVRKMKNKNKTYINISFIFVFHLMKMGGFSGKKTFRKFKQKQYNYFFNRFFSPHFRKKTKTFSLKIKNPLLLLYYKFLYQIFRLSHIFTVTNIKEKKLNIILNKLKRFSFLTQLFTIKRKNKLKNKLSVLGNVKLYKKKHVKITQKSNKLILFSSAVSRHIKKVKQKVLKRKILFKSKYLLTRTTPNTFRSILANWDTILNGIVKIEKSTRFKRNVIHSLYKYSSLVQFHKTINFMFPFRFFPKNMLKTIWLKQTFIAFTNYRRRKGNSLLTNIMLIRPVLREIKNLSTIFLKFFIKNPFCESNKKIPLNVHKVFLNSLKHYFIPLRSFGENKIPYPTYSTSSKRLSFTKDSLNPIKIMFSSYRQKKRTLQINILTSRNENLFSSWPGLAIKKISSIVGIHQAHKYTFLLHMKPKKAKKNVMAKSLAIRHASNFLYKYFKRKGGSFEIVVRTTTPVTSKIEDSYTRLLLSFLYKGFEKSRKKQFLFKKKQRIFSTSKKLQHLYQSRYYKDNLKISNGMYKKNLLKKKFKKVDQLLKNSKLKTELKLLKSKYNSLRSVKSEKNKVNFVKRKKYFLKYFFIFTKYLSITRKLIVLLLSRVLLYRQSEKIRNIQKAFNILQKFTSIFKSFLKSIFFAFFVRKMYNKRRKIRYLIMKSKIHKKMGRKVLFHTLIKRLRYGYFKLAKKVYLTEYNIYNQISHGFPTKKKKNRRL